MTTNHEQSSDLIGGRFTKLFEFLKAFNDLQYPLVSNIDQQLRTLWLGGISGHSGAELYRDESKESETATDNTIVFRVARPNVTPCPPPPSDLKEWLKPGWQKLDGKIEIQTSRKRFDRIEDDFRRLDALNHWTDEREQWVKNERSLRRASSLFQDVYEWFGMLEREGERVELLLGDGLLCWQHESGEFKHPVLLQKLELEFHPEKQEPEFIFRKREQPPELYREFLHALPGSNSQQIIQCDAELKAAEFSPLGGRDTQDFLRRLIQGLFPAGGEFCEPRQKPSGNGPYIERRPVIFMRQRRTGPANVFDLVLEDIGRRLQAGESFSSALMQILGLIDLTPPAVVPEVHTTLGNEDADILLSKPANCEQLQIARQLANRECVLVQGPPGTGKTHTIANLLGHLLAQGKRVLVTAHTPKALRILRDKVAEPLQPLCVSVLQNDKKSHEELQQSVRQIHVRLSQDDSFLEREASRLREERSTVLKELQEVRQRLLEARQEEIREAVISGKTFRPIEAAKQVKAGQGINDWIPGLIHAEQSLPLNSDQITALYQSNGRISPADERELNGLRLDLALCPSPVDFQCVMEEKQALAKQDMKFGSQFWHETSAPHEQLAFERMLEMADKAIEFFKDSSAWQLKAIQAGRDGEPSRRSWDALADFIDEAWREIHECHALVMEHGPTLSDQRPARVLLPILDDILQHLAEGGRINVLTRLSKPQWIALIQAIRINGNNLDVTKAESLRAVRAHLRIAILREELGGRWERMMTSGDAPPFAQLGDHPEEACRGFIGQIRACLEWHKTSWLPLDEQFARLGFDWPAYIASTVPEVGNDAELRRLRSAVVGDLVRILKARKDFLRHHHLHEKLVAWQKLVPERNDNEAATTRSFREAVSTQDATMYRAAFENLARLKTLEYEQQLRNHLLTALATAAPGWAAAIQNRQPRHDQPQPPGDPEAAWQWRQLYDELERRAIVDVEQLQQRVEALSHRLLKLTTELVEKQAWSHQIRTVTTAQKQALGAYVALRNRITKSGTGKKDAEFRAAARREIAVAKSAVPVWIMPLTEVADTFDPRSTRFDVVIIDEASQCDPSAMFALYLGRQTVIVGDDEQVTPVTVGVEAQEVMKLIHGYLDGVPRRELYDGQTSVYEFGQWAFGGAIRLVEHFRCASDIIAFSNALSYRGEIKPLREENSIKLKPHVIPYQVTPDLSGDSDINLAEAEAIASIICSTIKQPEYAVNEQGNPVTFGVVSLVGEKQALLIDDLLRRRLPAEEYQLRQILCGTPAHLQGDERDVVFLSMVDMPGDTGLPLRDPEGQMRMFKRRFNVAASRARDQMWVVYSLDPHTDLKPGDIRRRLIDHALDPKAWSRELDQRLSKLDQESEAFEGAVLRRLVERGYKVQAQVPVGSYRIALVVVGHGRRLAIECDGENAQDLSRLRENMERQAILERLGWKFVRVRGSLFFRDPERALAPVFRRMEELGIQPESATSAELPARDRSKLETRVIRQAEELRQTWNADIEPSAVAGKSRLELFKNEHSLVIL